MSRYNDPSQDALGLIEDFENRWGEYFDKDLDINGGDMVDWLQDFHQQAKDILKRAAEEK